MVVLAAAAVTMDVLPGGASGDEGGQSGGASWQGWWPSASELPDALFEGYLNALEEVFQLTAHRPHGFGDFEEQFTAATPPALTLPASGPMSSANVVAGHSAV